MHGGVVVVVLPPVLPVVLLGCGDVGPIHQPIESYSELVRAAVQSRFPCRVRRSGRSMPKLQLIVNHAITKLSNISNHAPANHENIKMASLIPLRPFFYVSLR